MTASYTGTGTIVLMVVYRVRSCTSSFGLQVRDNSPAVQTSNDICAVPAHDSGITYNGHTAVVSPFDTAMLRGLAGATTPVYEYDQRISSGRLC